MPKLKTLSGKEVIKILQDFGFFVEHTRGSHVKLVRIYPDKPTEVLMVPLHKEISKGTLKAIYSQSIKYIPETDLKKYFYAD